MTRPKPPTATCPICNRPTVDAYRPFCSRRCADIDLSRWLSGAYAIPVAEDDDEDGAMSEGEGPKDQSGRPH